MAFNKKNKRKIVVEKSEFYWQATGNDGWISLCVMSELEGSPKINCKFDYHHLPVKAQFGDEEIEILADQFVITPYIVRQTILYAISVGWKPFEKGRDLNLGHIDDKIDLRFDKNRATNDKKAWLQFSLQASDTKK